MLWETSNLIYFTAPERLGTADIGEELMVPDVDMEDKKGESCVKERLTWYCLGCRLKGQYSGMCGFLIHEAKSNPSLKTNGDDEEGCHIAVGVAQTDNIARHVHVRITSIAPQIKLTTLNNLVGCSKYCWTSLVFHQLLGVYTTRKVHQIIYDLDNLIIL